MKAILLLNIVLFSFCSCYDSKIRYQTQNTTLEKDTVIQKYPYLNSKRYEFYIKGLLQIDKEISFIQATEIITSIKYIDFDRIDIMDINYPITIPKYTIETVGTRGVDLRLKNNENVNNVVRYYDVKFGRYQLNNEWNNNNKFIDLFTEGEIFERSDHKSKLSEKYGIPAVKLLIIDLSPLENYSICLIDFMIYDLTYHGLLVGSDAAKEYKLHLNTNEINEERIMQIFHQIDSNPITWGDLVILDISQEPLTYCIKLNNETGEILNTNRIDIGTSTVRWHTTYGY